MDLSSLVHHLNTDTLVTSAAGALVVAVLLGLPKALWRGVVALWQRRKERLAEREAQAQADHDLAVRAKWNRDQALMTSMRNVSHHLPYLRRRAVESPQVSLADRQKAAQEGVDLVEGALSNARELGDASYLTFWEQQAREFASIRERLHVANEAESAQR
jgi:hypothetical protein